MTLAYEYFQRHEAKLELKEQLVVRFAIMYVEQGNRPMFELMLKKLPESGLKLLALYLAPSRFSDYSFDIDHEAIEFPMADDKLIESLQG